MRVEQVVRPYLVEFESIELVAIMYALLHFAQHSRAFSESAELNMVAADQLVLERSKCFIDIAETLIIRLQDALDEDQIGLLCREDGATVIQADFELESGRAKADKMYSDVREASRSSH